MNSEMISELTKEYSDINRGAEALRLIKKWSRVGLLEGLEGRKAQNMARMLENEAIGLRTLNESQVGDIAGFNKIAFPLVRRVFAQLIASEIVSVQPMSLPSGLLFYLDFVWDRTVPGYSSGGSVYGDRSAVANQKLEGIGAQNPTGGFYELNSNYSLRLFQLTPVGVSYTGTPSTTITTVASQTITGNLTAVDFDISTVSAYVDLGKLQSIRPALSGEVVYGVTDGTFRTLTQIQSLSSDTLGCASGSTYGVNVAKYDPSLTQFLNTGKIRMFFNDTSYFIGTGTTGTQAEVVLIGPAKTDVQDNPATTNLGDWEAVTAIPEINIQVKSVPVMAGTRKLKARWTPELAQDLNAYHALDAEVELTTILSEVISLEIDREIIGELIHGAKVKAAWSRKIGRYVAYSESGNTISTVVQGSAQSTFAGFFGTQIEWYQTLAETLNTVSNEIHKRSLRHGANFIVTSPEVSSILESMHMYKPTIVLDASEVSYSFGVEKVGTVSNKYTVFKDPYFPEGMILMGYKGGSFLETGFVYAPYVPLLVTPTIFAPEDFTPRKGVMTRYASQMIRPEFYGLVFVTDLNIIGAPASAVY
jgi:hypothetical protein